MNAKDTVTKTTEENCHNTLKERLLEQAEISFKAGYEDAVKHLQDPEVFAIAKDALKEAKLTGIREVVEFMEQRGDLHFNFPFRQVCKEEWQAKLKEWGID